MKVLNVVFATEDAAGGAVRAGLTYGDYLSNYINCVNAKMAGKVDRYLFKELDLKHPVLRLPQKNKFKNLSHFLPFPNRYLNVFGDTDFSKINLESFDIVHMHNPIPFYSMQRLARLCIEKDIPYVITTHGFQNMMNLPRDMNLNTLYRTVYKNLVLKKYLKVLEKAAALFALSKKGQEYLARLFPKQRIYLTSNGLKIEEFEISKKFTEVVKKKYGVADEKPKILYVGKINKKKGVDVLVKAMSKIDLDCQLFMIGPILDEHLGRKIQEYIDVDNRIKLLGYLPRKELIAFYKLSDIYVLPSYSEISPLSIREAMAAGLVVVTTDIEGNNELVTNYKTGRLFTPGNSEELANILEELMNREDERKRMGEIAKKIAMKEFDWNMIVKKNLKTYEELIEETKKN